MNTSDILETRVSENDSKYNIHIVADYDYSLDMMGDIAGSLYIKDSRHYGLWYEQIPKSKGLSKREVFSEHYQAAIEYLDKTPEGQAMLKDLIYNHPDRLQDYHEYWEYSFKYRYNQTYPESYRQKIPTHQERIWEYLSNLPIDQWLEDDEIEDLVYASCTVVEKSTQYSDILLIIDPDIAKKEGLINDGKDYAEAVVKETKAVLDGDVYGYIITPADDEDDTELDSCWGYIGYDHDKSGLIEAAEDSCYWLGIQAEEKHIEALGAILEACGHS